MTKLNLVVTVMLLAGIFIPGIALASGVVTDSTFGGLFLKMLVPISGFLLLNNIVAHVAHKKG